MRQALPSTDVKAHEQADPVEKTYAAALEKLKAFAETLPNTRLLAVAKVTTMAVLNMRWERLMVDRALGSHPYLLVANMIDDARSQLAAWHAASFIEAPEHGLLDVQTPGMEERHHDLFQALWVNFSPSDYEERIERYLCRLRINGLAGGFLAGMRCIDFGCGHGNFAHALLREGAARVLGIDYGEDSVRYASAARDRLGVPIEHLEFRVESVYEVHESDGAFDLAVQNGVFHHLDDEDRAYREVHRVLRPGGWMWVYTCLLYTSPSPRDRS